jgi:fermentation-respiration switch protein FrsA (DUF1100 family)
MAQLIHSGHGSVRRRVATAMVALVLAGCGSAPTTHAVPLPAKKAQARGLKLKVSNNSMEGFVANAFDRADTDQDGFLSGKESGLNAAQFRAFDRDNDGVISREEWNQPMSPEQAMAALAPFQPLIDATFVALDTNKDGVVSLAEARAAVPPDPQRSLAPEPLKLAVVLSAFRQADTLGAGVLTRAAFPAFYIGLGQRGTNTVMRGWFSSIADALLAAYLAVTSRIGEHVAMHPSRKAINQTPAKWNIPFEEVSFKTADGLTLKGWFIPAATPTDNTVIEVHGINDCRDTFVREGQIKMLNPKYNQLAFDLRNQGQSDGEITSFGFNEGKDVVAAKAYLQTRGIQHIAVYGISLGAAAAIRGGAIDPQLMGVVDDCAYTTCRSAFAGFASALFIPGSELIAAAILERGNEELGADMTTTEPISQVRSIAPRPLLVIHGANDPNVPAEDSQLNYQAAGDGFHKELWIVPGAGHAVSALVQPVQYEKHLLDFFAVVFGNAGLVGMPAPRI